MNQKTIPIIHHFLHVIVEKQAWVRMMLQARLMHYFQLWAMNLAMISIDVRSLELIAGQLMLL